jgi:hypothetical protein
MSNIQVMPWDYNKPIKIKNFLKNQSSIPNKYNVEGWNWKKKSIKKQPKKHTANQTSILCYTNEITQ